MLAQQHLKALGNMSFLNLTGFMLLDSHGEKPPTDYLDQLMRVMVAS